ncbi:MAG: PEP-CTERM sorting domain-containing protein [Armatimonadota bacterium]|nr:PEP-CTERM sorting domain-containing protein [Armatimonadota bacterium]
MKYRFPQVIWAVLASVVIISAPAAALDLDLLLPVGSADEHQYDFATTPGAAHVVYRSGGNVYYATISKDNMNWSVRSLGPGNWPTVAGNAYGQVVVAYENGGTIYEVGPHNGWVPSAVVSGISGGKPVISSPFFASGWQMVITGNCDGDSYAEVVRVANSGSGWSSPQVLLDGWYDSGFGNYYPQAGIAAFADGSYALAYEADNWGGRASWSDKWVGVSGVGPNFGVGADWYASLQLSRRPVSAISEGSLPGKAVFACSVNNRIYAGINDGSGWVWLLSNYDGGSAPAVSWSGGVFADAGGVLRFVTSDDQGIVIEPLVYQGTNLTGSAPLIWAMEDKFFLFRDPSGVLQLGASFVNVVPEPASLVSLFVGVAGFLGVSARRKNR